jgi:hypothetical protein
MLRGPWPVYSLLRTTWRKQYCDDFQRNPKNLIALDFIAPRSAPPSAQCGGGPPAQPIGLLPAHRRLRCCRCVHRLATVSRGACWIFKTFPARRCLFPARSEYNNKRQRSTPRFDGSRRRTVPGRKHIRSIDGTAANPHPPFDPHNIHCARARCRPPRVAYRGGTVLLRS